MTALVMSRACRQPTQGRAVLFGQGDPARLLLVWSCALPREHDAGNRREIKPRN